MNNKSRTSRTARHPQSTTRQAGFANRLQSLATSLPSLGRLKSTDGSTLASATISSAVFSIMIAAVMSYMSNEFSLNVRSHGYNQAFNLAEAAVEIGFAELNNQYFQGGSGFTSGRGWIGLGGGVYQKTVNGLTDTQGRPIGDANVTVSGVGTTSPQILGVGTVTGELVGTNIARAVRAVVAPSSRYPVALASKQRLDLNGNNIYTDSFDSTDSGKSTGGFYDQNKRQTNGDIASQDSLENSVNIGNADVFGRVSTGFGGTVEMGANGSIGPTTVAGDRATSISQGEANGWIRHDFNADMPDVVLPAGASSWYSQGAINNNTTLGSGDYKVSSISLSGSKKLTIEGNVRLYITGNASVTGNASIEIATNATLQIYAAGSMAIAGNGVANLTGRAGNNQFFGLPSSTSWSISGNGQWIGTVYAPQAAFTMNGGGSAGDMSGAVVAQSITLNGQVKFHYDEQLRDNSMSVGYAVAAWQTLHTANGSWVAD